MLFGPVIGQIDHLQIDHPHIDRLHVDNLQIANIQIHHLDPLCPALPLLDTVQDMYTTDQGLHNTDQDLCTTDQDLYSTDPTNSGNMPSCGSCRLTVRVLPENKMS